MDNPLHSLKSKVQSLSLSLKECWPSIQTLKNQSTCSVNRFKASICRIHHFASLSSVQKRSGKRTKNRFRSAGICLEFTRGERGFSFSSGEFFFDCCLILVSKLICRPLINISSNWITDPKLQTAAVHSQLWISFGQTVKNHSRWKMVKSLALMISCW
jgi:hypothetical protein